MPNGIPEELKKKHRRLAPPKTPKLEKGMRKPGEQKSRLPTAVHKLRQLKRQERGDVIEELYAVKQTGRPLTYRGDPHDRLCSDLRLAGCTKDQIARAFGLTSPGLMEWIKKYPTFKYAYESSGDVADALVARRMFQRAIGWEHEAEKVFCNQYGGVTRVPYTERFAPDVSAATFWLTNRKGKNWKNRNNTELTGPDGEPLSPPQVVINPVAAKKGE